MESRRRHCDCADRRCLVNHEQRISRAYGTALPFLADQLEHKSVWARTWDLQVAAARGLVDVGSRDVAGDLLAVTKMRDDGVRQIGEQTSLAWGQEPGKRVVSVTTGLHESQEQAFIQLVQVGRGWRRSAAGEVAAAEDEQSGLDLLGAGAGAASRRCRASRAGWSLRIDGAGLAGAGKTTALKPLVAAWSRAEVYGASLAWRQADELTDAGIDRRNVKAFSVLLQAMQERRPDDPAPDFPPLKLRPEYRGCSGRMGHGRHPASAGAAPAAGAPWLLHRGPRRRQAMHGDLRRRHHRPIPPSAWRRTGAGILRTHHQSRARTANSRPIPGWQGRRGPRSEAGRRHCGDGLWRLRWRCGPSGRVVPRTAGGDRHGTHDQCADKQRRAPDR